MRQQFTALTADRCEHNTVRKDKTLQQCRRRHVDGRYCKQHATVTTKQIFAKHQKAIARRTLGLSLLGADMLGGMTHVEAYRILFRRSLQERARELMARYPERPVFLSWELDQYGWTWDDLPTLAAL